jgi:hypothetical protein
MKMKKVKGNRIKKVLCVLMVMTLIAVFIPASTVFASEPWREAYANYLRGHIGEFFALHDMSGNGIPELFRHGGWGPEAFTFRNGEMRPLIIDWNPSINDGISVPAIGYMNMIFIRWPMDGTTVYAIIENELQSQDVIVIVHNEDNWSDFEVFVYIEGYGDPVIHSSSLDPRPAGGGGGGSGGFVPLNPHELGLQGEDHPRFTEAIARYQYPNIVPMEFTEVTEANIQSMVLGGQADAPVTPQTTVTLPTAPQNANEANVVINGILLSSEVAPQIIDGRTMLPLRAIGEALGLTVDFDASQNLAVLFGTNTFIAHQINTTQIIVNNETRTFDVASTIVGGRTLVPVRMLAEAIGAEVEWDAATRTAIITTN